MLDFDLPEERSMSRVPEADRIAFDEATLLEEARAKAGLSDFGDEGFGAPLEQLLRSLREEARLNEIGRGMMRSRILESLETRLQTESWIARHPEILDEEIGAPIVVIGLMRTGTTMLQRVLASDPRLHAAMWWETRFPAPFSDTRWDAPDPRIPRGEAEVAAILEADPDQASVHPWDALAPDEEIMLLEHAFMSHVPEAFCNLPSYRAWLDEQDWTPAYAYLKRLLQFLQWQKRQRGNVRERWVLKTPGHLGYIDTLFSVFPGARVIQTHRDPVETVPSAVSMNFKLWDIYSDHADAHEVGRQWNHRLSWGMKRCMEARTRYAEDRFVDLWFRDALSDPLTHIEEIYETFGIEMIPEARIGMAKWLEENRRDKRPAHRYTLEEFGFTDEGIKADFAEYRKRFIEPRL